MRQAIAAAMDFRKAGVLKLPAPRSEAGKVGSINICLVGNAQLIQTSPGLQGAGAGSGVRAGPESCMLRAWSWGWRVPQPALKWPWHVATCRPLGLCHCLLVRCRVSFQLWQQIPGPATCKLQWRLPVQCWRGRQTITAPRVTPCRPPPSWARGLQGMA